MQLIDLPFDSDTIFNIQSEEEFNRVALEVFKFQYSSNTIYNAYCKQLNINIQTIQHYSQIPFLPISFFKTHEVKSGIFDTSITFKSSGTSGTTDSKHHLKDLIIYEQSFTKMFESYFGPVKDKIIIGLLPSYLEKGGSSLVYMVNKLIELSQHEDSGFYLNNYGDLVELIENSNKTQIVLFGVAYALLDLTEIPGINLNGVTVIETGGMKGRRKELTKEELHENLKKGLNVTTIYSEYGMTELLSQAYSKGLRFTSPNWMKILIREYNDPFELIQNRAGGINIIDLANLYSCSFIATQDLGKKYNATFEVLGRFDNADLRGCNLLVQ
jgi:phenylacetate-coenzyme A ligase PaaK-like adenylate-forming protein